MPTPRTPETNEPDHELIELFTQAQAEVADLSQNPNQLRRLLRTAEATPDHVAPLGFINPHVVLDQLPDGIDVLRLEVYALANRFNRILLATDIYTHHDYADFLVKGLDHKD